MHKGLEHLIRGDDLHTSMQAMYDYFNAEYPSEPDTIIYTCFEMLKLYPIENFKYWDNPITEHKLRTTVQLPGPTPREIVVRGMADVTDFTRLCDHKCKGRIYPTECAEELGDDLQMNLYSYVLRTPQWQYDLIQCPLVAYQCPERRSGVSAEAYANMLFNTYDNYKYFFPISKFVRQWVCCIPYYQPLEKVDLYFAQTIAPLFTKFCDWWDYVTSPGFDPNNPDCFNHIFYKNPSRVFDPAKTDKYKGNYHSLMNGVSELSDLIPVPSFYPELE